jgi:hypothetical protein
VFGSIKVPVEISRFVAAVALVGVLLFGILKGVVVAAIASILLLIQHVARPHVAFLSRIPGIRRFSDLARHEDNERIPGVLAFRVESGIVYFNVDHVFRVVLDRVEAEVKTIRLVVCDLSTSPNVDLAGVRMFLELHTELAKRGIVCVSWRPMLRSVTCFAWKELRIGLAALTGLRQWLLPSSTFSPAARSPGGASDDSRRRTRFNQSADAITRRHLSVLKSLLRSRPTDNGKECNRSRRATRDLPPQKLTAASA